MLKKSSILAFLAFSVFIFTSCDKDDPEIVNEEELITTVNYVISDESGNVITTMNFTDLDGDGGNDATIVGGTLSANTMYVGNLELLNESESPAEDITEEISEEDDEHQFFFETNVAGLTFEYVDEDGNGNPVGLESDIMTGDAGSGTITITLRHEPNKTADGVAGGDITNAGGETDIEVTFPIVIE